MTADRITVDPGRMGGQPCIRDTRMTVGMVLGQLASGGSFQQVLAHYPYLERDDIVAALRHAADVVVQVPEWKKEGRAAITELRAELVLAQAGVTVETEDMRNELAELRTELGELRRQAGQDPEHGS